MTVTAQDLHEQQVLQDHLIDQLVSGEGYEQRDATTWGKNRRMDRGPDLIAEAMRA